MASTEKIAEYAAALTALLKETTLDQIRVKDICERCGTDRQNFYYYFKDKYDLAAWIYKLDYAENMADHSNSIGMEQLAGMLERMRSKSDIYIKLFEDTSQNALFPYMLESEYERFLQLRAARKVTTPITDEEICEASFDLAGFFQAMVSWVRGEYALSPLAFAELSYLMIDEQMKYYYGFEESK